MKRELESPKSPCLGHFGDFLRLKRKFVNYRKLPYFHINLGDFLGEDLGESVPPNAMSNFASFFSGSRLIITPKNSYPPIFKKFPQKSLKNIDRYHCCTCSSTSDVEGRISWEIQNLTIYLSFGIIKREYI